MKKGNHEFRNCLFISSHTVQFSNYFLEDLKKLEFYS